jgi:hypothetical protein
MVAREVNGVRSDRALNSLNSRLRLVSVETFGGSLLKSWGTWFVPQLRLVKDGNAAVN